MIVYVDILIVLNLIVDYFMLLATASLLRRRFKFIRLFLSAVIGALFSLYIFLPQSETAVEISVRGGLCFLMSFVAFGFVNFKEFLKASGLLFGVNCLYAGIMMAVWKLFSPRSMAINNSVVYFDISALALIGFTVAFYLLFSLCSKLFSSNGKMAQKCQLTLEYGQNSCTVTALLDSGNSLCDLFGYSEIIIVGKSVAERLFYNIDMNSNPALKSRYRAIPLSTVAGSDMLDGFRCDGGYAILGKEKVYIKNPIIAISKTSFDSGYEGIINPKIFRNAVEDNVKINQKVFK